MMDCETALRLVEVCRPSGDDLADPELAPVAEHLEDCPECLRRFRAIQAVDGRIATAMRAVDLPHGLHDRILARLDRAPTRRRTLLIGIAASAAALVLAAGLGLWLTGGPLPPTPRQVTAVELGDEAEATEISGLVPVPNDRTPGQLADWCARNLRVVGQPPKAIELVNLVGAARASLADCWVAVFRYRDPRGPANHSTDVFVCPPERFTVEGAGSAPQRVFDTQGRVVVVWMEGRTTYVAVFRGWIPPEWDRPRNPRRSPDLT